MASQEEKRIKSQFDVLSKDAFFDVLLPRSADFDVSRTLRDGSGEDLHRAPSRRNLFFGSIIAFVDSGNLLTYR